MHTESFPIFHCSNQEIIPGFLNINFTPYSTVWVYSLGDTSVQSASIPIHLKFDGLWQVVLKGAPNNNAIFGFSLSEVTGL